MRKKCRVIFQWIESRHEADERGIDGQAEFAANIGSGGGIGAEARSVKAVGDDDPVGCEAAAASAHYRGRFQSSR